VAAVVRQRIVNESVPNRDLVIHAAMPAWNDDNVIPQARECHGIIFNVGTADHLGGYWTAKAELIHHDRIRFGTPNAATRAATASPPAPR
jgi:hypothetical protein